MNHVQHDLLVSLAPSSGQIAEDFLERGDYDGYLECFDRKNVWYPLWMLAQWGTCEDQLPRLFANTWIGSDQWPAQSEIEFLVSKIGAKCPKAFNARDLATFDALPDQITIYRGFRGRNKRSRCWTLSREKAVWFAQISLLHLRCRDAIPRISRLTIAKEDILFFTNDREEEEVVLAVPRFPLPHCELHSRVRLRRA